MNLSKICVFLHKEKGEDILKRMWITSCGYTLENVNFPGCGNSLKCKFPHMRIYSYYCEFPLVEVHPKMCNSAVRIFTKFSELPQAAIHCSMWIPSWGKVYYLMRIYTRKGEFPKTRKFTKIWFFRIWGYTLVIVNLHLWKCTRECVYPLCGFTRILVNDRMRRYTV